MGGRTGGMDGRMDGWTDGLMDGQTGGQVGGPMVDRAIWSIVLRQPLAKVDSRPTGTVVEILHQAVVPVVLRARRDLSEVRMGRWTDGRDCRHRSRLSPSIAIVDRDCRHRSRLSPSIVDRDRH